MHISLVDKINAFSPRLILVIKYNSDWKIIKEAKIIIMRRLKSIKFGFKIISIAKVNINNGNIIYSKNEAFPKGINEVK